MPSFESGTAAGEYTMTIGAQTAGSCQFGKTLNKTILTSPIQGSDKWGDTITGDIIRGAALTIQFNFKTWDAAVIRAMDATNTNSVSTMLQVPSIGNDLYDIAKTIVLTPKAGTPAAITGPTSITLDKTIIEPGFPLSILLDSQLRILPVRMRVYPVDRGGGVYSFGIVV